MTEDHQPSQRVEEAAMNYFLGSIYRQQYLSAAIAGIVSVLLAVAASRIMTHSDIEELKHLIQGSRCSCNLLQQPSISATNRVTLVPDENSIGSLTRRVLEKQGSIHGDVPGTTGSTGDGDR